MESLSDIVAEMCRNGDTWREDKSTNKTECLGLITLKYADRIEAAWKREKAEIEADALAVGGIVEAARHSPGNAAAMREALIAVSKAFDDSLICTDSQMSMEECDRLDDVYHKVKAALSATARNCDRFADEIDAQIEFLNEVWLISVTKETALERDRFENWTDEMRTRYGRWLLAPAAERKGELDGR